MLHFDIEYGLVTEQVVFLVFSGHIWTFAKRGYFIDMQNFIWKTYRS